MDALRTTLRRLRDWFLAWFIVEAVAGTATAAYVLDGMGHHSLLGHATTDVGATGTVIAGVVVSLVVLLLACAVLEALINLRPWARVVMLVIGWITVVSAAINFLVLPASAALLPRLVRLTGSDWTVLTAVSVLTKAVDLAFWSWAIYVLQINQAVRAAFLRRDSSPAML